jgi:hypothetical protein
VFGEKKREEALFSRSFAWRRAVDKGEQQPPAPFELKEELTTRAEWRELRVEMIKIVKTGQEMG